MYLAGKGKAEINAFEKDVGMYGYGMYYNIVKGQATPIFARAFVIRDQRSESTIAIVNAELCFITNSIKIEVVKRLADLYPDSGIGDANLMITASHTHSAPGGYSHYAFYNITTPGFRPKILDAIVTAIVDAIGQALEGLKPSRLFYNDGSFAPEDRIGYNRSLVSYNKNPDVASIPEGKEHLAMDPTMYQIKVTDPEGKPSANLSWFGLHNTNVGNRNRMIHSDNKGFACKFFEEAFGEDGVVAAFMQTTAGDISPHFHGKYDFFKRWYSLDKEYLKAEESGRKQFQKSLEIYEKEDADELKGAIDYDLIYVDFSDVKVDPLYANGFEKAHTGKAVHGLSFFQGTPIDGRGIPGPLAAVVSKVAATVRLFDLAVSRLTSKEEYTKTVDKYDTQGNKVFFMETGEKKVLGTTRIDRLIVPDFIDPTIAYFREQYNSGGMKEHTWVPHILPIQIFSIGDTAIAALPTEITTTAGKRLRETIMASLRPKKIKHLILASYANDYVGYITTFEEYQVQRYEGGHTVFGKWTLGAFQTKFRELAHEFTKPRVRRNLDRTTKPPVFSEEELNARTG